MFLQGSQISSFACVWSWIRLRSRFWFFRIGWWHTCSWWPNDIEGHLTNCWFNWSLFFPFDFTSFSLLSQFLINHNVRTFYTVYFILVSYNHDYFTFIKCLNMIQFVFKLPPTNIWNVMTYRWKSLIERII